MAEEKFCPYEEGHWAPIKFFGNNAARKDGLSVYCRRHASEASHPERNRQLSGTCDECGKPARTVTCPDCLWAERLILETCDTRDNSRKEEEFSSASEFQSSESVFGGLSGPTRQGKVQKFSWKTV